MDDNRDFGPLIPKRIAEHEIVNNLVVLKQVRKKNKTIQKLFNLKDSYNFLKLDEVGSKIWLSCDGKKSVRELTEVLSEAYGEDFDPSHLRLVFFLKALEESNYISF